MLVDTADRGRRHIEGEVGEAREHMSQLTNANNALSVDKRRLEQGRGRTEGETCLLGRCAASTLTLG